jgi:hypothetical protein
MTDLLDLIKGTPAHRLMAKKATITFDQSQRFVVKGGGEGSRGGHVIGHTTSGKAIYAAKGKTFSAHHAGGHLGEADHEDRRQEQESYAHGADAPHLQTKAGAGVKTLGDKMKAVHTNLATAHRHMSAARKHDGWAKKSPKEILASKEALQDYARGAGAGGTGEDWSEKKLPASAARAAAAHRKEADVYAARATVAQAKVDQHHEWVKEFGDTTVFDIIGEPGAQKSVDDTPDLVKGGGPYIGKRGGKWADPQHKIPWKEGKSPSKQRSKTIVVFSAAGARKVELPDPDEATATANAEFRDAIIDSIMDASDNMSDPKILPSSRSTDSRRAEYQPNAPDAVAFAFRSEAGATKTTYYVNREGSQFKVWVQPGPRQDPATGGWVDSPEVYVTQGTTDPDEVARRLYDLGPNPDETNLGKSLAGDAPDLLKAIERYDRIAENI